MIECIATHQGLFWALTLLLFLSEALGETKSVKANGVLSFILELLELLLRFLRKILYRK